MQTGIILERVGVHTVEGLCASEKWMPSLANRP